MSGRLTVYERDKIADNAAAMSFADRESVLLAQENQLADRTYRTLVSESELTKVLAVPERWIAKTEHLQLNVMGSSIYPCFPEGEPRPIFSSGGRHAVIEEGMLASDILANANAKRLLNEERRLARRKVRYMLDQVSSVKQLEKLWPDGRQFYDFLYKPQESLPVPHVGEVNALLGITKETATNG